MNIKDSMVVIVMMVNLIGVSGKINSGKDTVGKIIQYLDWKESVEKGNSKSLHYTFEEFLNGRISFVSDWEIKKFADKLKDIVCLLINCTRQQLEDREFKEKLLGEEWDKYVIVPANTSKALVYCDKEKAERVAETYGLKMREDGTVDSSLIERVKMTPRKLLQLLGTDAGRKVIHPNIWVNSLFADYKPLRITGGVSKLAYGTSVLSNEPHKAIMPKWIITDVRFPNEVKAIKDRGGIVIRVKRPLERFDSGLYKLQHKIVTEHFSETALDDYKGWNYIIDNNGTLENLKQKIYQIYLTHCIQPINP